MCCGFQVSKQLTARTNKSQVARHWGNSWHTELVACEGKKIWWALLWLQHGTEQASPVRYEQRTKQLTLTRVVIATSLSREEELLLTVVDVPEIYITIGLRSFSGGSLHLINYPCYLSYVYYSFLISMLSPRNAEYFYPSLCPGICVGFCRCWVVTFTDRLLKFSCYPRHFPFVPHTLLCYRHQCLNLPRDQKEC